MGLEERVIAAIRVVTKGGSGGGGGHVGELVVIGWPAGDEASDVVAPLEDEGEGGECQGKDNEEQEETWRWLLVVDGAMANVTCAKP